MRRRQYLAAAGAGIGWLLETTSVSATELEVASQETNAPAVAGDVFVARVDIFNHGSMGAEELHLVIDEVLDTETIEARAILSRSNSIKLMTPSKGPTSSRCW